MVACSGMNRRIKNRQTLSDVPICRTQKAEEE